MYWSYYPHRSRELVSPLCGIFFNLFLTVPWWAKWLSRGRSFRCGGLDRTVVWALISVHSAIISSSQLVPLSFSSATWCPLILMQPTKMAQQLRVSLDFKSTAGCLGGVTEVTGVTSRIRSDQVIEWPSDRDLDFWIAPSYPHSLDPQRPLSSRCTKGADRQSATRLIGTKVRGAPRRLDALDPRKPTPVF